MTSLPASRLDASFEAKPIAPIGDARREAWAAYFEAIYQSAEGRADRVPWADARPNPSLLSWLQVAAPGVLRPGAVVTVVGCGLGDDVIELIGRGYDVIGFDCSPSAIDWARRRYPHAAERFVVADLMDLPSSLRRRADLVVEVYTIQSVDPSLRVAMVEAITSLARPRQGIVLTVCRGRDASEPIEAIGAPPYPLSACELASLMKAHDLHPMSPVDDFMDDESPPVRRLRGAFRRS